MAEILGSSRAVVQTVKEESEMKYRCSDCLRIIDELDFLHAANPFEPGHEILGCPYCSNVENFSMVCEVTGCELPVACGYPGEDGVYHHTCGKHNTDPDRLRRIG